MISSAVSSNKSETNNVTRTTHSNQMKKSIKKSLYEIEQNLTQFSTSNLTPNLTKEALKFPIANMEESNSKSRTFHSVVESYLNVTKFISAASGYSRSKVINDDLVSVTSSESDTDSLREVSFYPSRIESSNKETELMPAVYSILKSDIFNDEGLSNTKKLIEKDLDQEDDLFIAKREARYQIGLRKNIIGSEENMHRIDRPTSGYKSFKRRTKSCLNSFFTVVKTFLFAFTENVMSPDFLQDQKILLK